ncbi:hypothetical protein SAMN05878282_11459 [Aquipseudomonas alcaligenes]|uniref:Uncharacterized protein n=2 Tax=Aquipseudomonas alcaligenes TaxID=43263 RepID=A0A1N6XS19_AQUAC|nr:hypothetical protein SAMN05878282_11459 [Pseudomonas alcaligenes]
MIDSQYVLGSLCLLKGANLAIQASVDQKLQAGGIPIQQAIQGVQIESGKLPLYVKCDWVLMGDEPKLKNVLSCFMTAAGQPLVNADFDYD